MARIIACGTCNDFVGVGAYSDDDGLTWIQLVTPLDGGFMHDVCWDEDHSQFVMVGESPLESSGAPYTDDRMIQTSPDGDIWTARATPVDDPTGTLQGPVYVAAGNGVIVAAGYDNLADAWSILVSTDGGVTWTSHAAPFTGSFGETINDLEFANGEFMLCATGAPTNQGIWRSTDGETWTNPSGAPNAVSGPPSRCLWDGAHWIFAWQNQATVGTDNNQGVYVYTEPSTWAFHRFNPGPGNFFGVAAALAYNGTVHLAVNMLVGSNYWTSPDAAAWTQHSGVANVPGWNNVGDALWTGTAFIIGDQPGGNPNSRSTDATIWTTPTTPMDKLAGIAIQKPAATASPLWYAGRHRT